MKVKLTKGELKRQRDALQRYLRFLPTLQLKKQQLQLEIQHQLFSLEEKRHLGEKKMNQLTNWAGLLSQSPVDLNKIISVEKVNTGTRNIAGVDIPIFLSLDFKSLEYDLFITPLWLDTAIVALKELITLGKEIGLIEQGVKILRGELRIATQRVNLFEKVKIPESEEAIRLIKIYIGDQMANAVGRSKIAKRKIEEVALEEALV
ncbi:MAG: V-type ATP synthase subunit D [Candidatus Omnitrophica bacterium]|nr:V-type ATP synthase subunit D [Candidatus Omnitrophota bacterium]MDD5237823.1 V-type ATP synthase subunit D [Candidatus Omnitrophota bacterium]